MTKKTIAIQRLFKAPLADVWDLWTTKDGIESWWGPGGFKVTVRAIDLRPGGVLLYAMTARGAEQIAFMKREGMPTTTEARITYTEIVPQRRLVYSHLVDFVPNVKPYDVTTMVELQAQAGGVRMVLTIDAMHDEIWTQRAQMGWESEVDKLGALLAARKTAAS